MPEPDGFIVVLPRHIEIIPYSSNLSWLTLFYALPRELVEKRPAYLNLPRNINVLLASDEAKALIENDLFLELVWDCYAWAVWQFFQIPLKDGSYRDIPGDWSDYSGDFPLWRMSYLTTQYIRDKFEHAMDWSFQRLFLMPEEAEVPWLTYKQFGNLVGNLTDMIVKEQNWQPMIDEIWRNRQEEDYSGNSYSKRDFMKAWQHTRSVKQRMTLEDLDKLSADELDAQGLRRDETDQVISSIDLDQFMDGLNERDQQILKLRIQGKTLEEIAPQVGYSAASSVHKRIQQIAEAYRKRKS